MTRFKEKYKPAIPRRMLPVIAGAMWWFVGIMLTVMALRWLWDYNGDVLHFFFSGIIAALVIHHFGFLRLADRNLERISRLPARSCVFSFISWKSYFLIAIMISLGIILRHSTIPREYLSVIYMGIGLALFLSGIRYFRSSL